MAQVMQERGTYQGITSAFALSLRRTLQGVLQMANGLAGVLQVSTSQKKLTYIGQARGQIEHDRPYTQGRE
jgi:hypothetical protein